MARGERDPRCSSVPRWRLAAVACVSCVLWTCDTLSAAYAQASATIAPAISVEVSDEWMAYLDREDQRQFEQQRWFAGTGFSLAAVGWGIGLTLRQRAHQSALSGALLSAALAASAGFAAGSLWIRDPNTASLVVNLGAIAEFVMASHTLTLLTNRGCTDDCFLMLSADSTTAVGSALVTLLTNALYPPLRISAHYAAYTRMPRTRARALFALRLFEERERRQQRTEDINLVYALAFSVGYAIAATHAHTESGRIVLGASGGALALYQSISYLWTRLSTKPSERLRANLPP